MVRDNAYVSVLDSRAPLALLLQAFGRMASVLVSTRTERTRAPFNCFALMIEVSPRGLQMGAAGGTPAEAAYAAAAAAAADGPTVDDTWYAARASATLDAIKHRQSDNREIVNSIVQVLHCTVPSAFVVKHGTY